MIKKHTIGMLCLLFSLAFSLCQAAEPPATPSPQTNDQQRLLEDYLSTLVASINQKTPLYFTKDLLLSHLSQTGTHLQFYFVTENPSLTLTSDAEKQQFSKPLGVLCKDESVAVLFNEYDLSFEFILKDAAGTLIGSFPMDKTFCQNTKATQHLLFNDPSLLQKQIDTIQSILPIDWEGMSWINIALLKKNTLLFRFLLKEAQTIDALSRPKNRQVFKDLMCDQPLTASMLNQGLSIRFEFVDKERKKHWTATLTKKDCSPKTTH